jgi:hypothetical protein
MTSVLESDDNNGTRIVTSCNGEPDFIRKQTNQSVGRKFNIAFSC